VIADPSPGEKDGLALAQEICAREVTLPILVLTIHNSATRAGQVFRAGASGYVTKQELSETLLVAIRSVPGGTRYVSLRTRTALGKT
jgi:DNA-binding NarL/FixJ family response regulator